jgi:hypothetical protein
LGGFVVNRYVEDDDVMSSDGVEELRVGSSTSKKDEDDTFYTSKKKYNEIRGCRVDMVPSNIIYEDDDFIIYMQTQNGFTTGKIKINIHVVDTSSKRDISKVIEFTEVGHVIRMRYFVLRECFCSNLMVGSTLQTRKFQRESQHFGTRIFVLLLNLFHDMYHWKIFMITWLPIVDQSQRTGASRFFTEKFGFVRHPENIAELVKYCVNRGEPWTPSPKKKRNG